MFITFEGIDCCGKTTQAQRLVERLSVRPLPGDEQVRSVRLIREPGGTPISERLRAILLDRTNLDLSDRAEILLFSASRAQLVHQVIRPALAGGEIVICDRYYDSTTAYQGFGRGLDLRSVLEINRFATSALTPDLTFLVDIPVEEIPRRKASSGHDRMESAGDEFYARVRNGYLELARLEPHRFAVVNGVAPIDVVENEIWGTLERFCATIHRTVQR
jgi:dTMP kinase